MPVDARPVAFSDDVPTTSASPDIDVELPGAFLLATAPDGEAMFASGDGDLFRFERDAGAPDGQVPTAIPEGLTVHGTSAAVGPIVRLPLGIAVGAISGLTIVGDDVWAADFDAGQVVHLHPDGSRTSIVVPGGPRSLTMSGGDLWTYTEHAFPHTMVRIDPRTGSIVQAVPVPGFGAVGPGAIWAADETQHRLSRLDGSTGDDTATFDLLAVDGCSINVEHLLGQVWAWCFDGPFINRVDGQTMQALPPLDVAGIVSGMVMIGDRLWIQQGPAAGHPGRMLRVAADGGRVDRIVVIEGSDADGMAVFDGGLWLAVDGKDRLQRVALAAFE